ncbi:MAG: radical SAM protein [Burkholderiaceae bacterium]
MSDILLVTLNARYSHASLGLRCLYANLGELQARAGILEFVIGTRTETLAERILRHAPRIVGFGVYIWNVDETARLVAMLKRIAPALKIVLGGPEVSHETAEQRICRDADHVITGPGDLGFARLCRQLLDGPRPLSKLIAGEGAELAQLQSPYPHYTDTDLRQRTLYVEASRGCPYKCEFCLSALDRTAVPFPLEPLLGELARLHERGARLFKFVDRTFNLKPATSAAILEFFLQRIEAHPDEPLFAHFELVPDHLPDRLRELILRFPPGALQFEIGIQTWNPAVQALISRRQDNAKAEAHIGWLSSHTQAHLHIDLIAGLPGEDLDSFAAGFDRLLRLGPHEIQVGILKRLRGAPIARHTDAFGLRFNPDPPYNVLATDHLPFATLQRISRFAQHWDRVANSGRFAQTLPVLLGAAAGETRAPASGGFDRFMAFSDWLSTRSDDSGRMSAERLFEQVGEWLHEGCALDRDAADALLLADYRRSGLRGRPADRAGRALKRQQAFARQRS